MPGNDSGNEDKLLLQQRAWLCCGDIHSLVAKTANFPHGFVSKSDNDVDDNPIVAATHQWSKELPEEKSVCLKFHDDLEATLTASIDSYKHAEICGKKGTVLTIQQRLGNSWNELGIYYMKATLVMDYAKNVKLVEKYWKSSYACLTDGLACFDVCGDIRNKALVSANLGRLMRQCAAVFSTQAADEHEEFSQQEKVYYDKAISYYQSALQLLKNRNSHSEIWASIENDLSGVCFIYGTMLQDRAPLSRLSTQEVEREVLQILLKCLQHTEPELDHCARGGPQHAMLCLRAGDSHYRLASLYHHSIRSGTTSQHRTKQARGQAEKHYKKAISNYVLEHHYWKILQVHIEYASLLESYGPKPRSPQASLKHILECKSVIEFYLNRDDKVEANSSNSEDSTSLSEDKDLPKNLLNLLTCKLRQYLKELVASSMKKSNGDAIVKDLYGTSLKIDTEEDTRNLSRQLYNLLTEISIKIL